MGSGVGAVTSLVPTTTNSSTQGSGSSAQKVIASGTVDTNMLFRAPQVAALDAAQLSPDYIKQTAIADSTAAVNQNMAEMLKTQLPGLTSASKASGGYDSTTASMLNNDLAARTAAAGANTQLSTINSYAADAANLIAANTGAVTATTGRNIVSAGTSTTAAQQSSQTAGSVSTSPLGTVICTQLYLDGHITARIYDADNKYVRRHISIQTVNGYRFWAVPFVYLMRRSSIAYAVGKYLGTKWSEHCASHYLYDVSPNKVGRFMLAVGVPISHVIGSMIPDVEYYKLWRGS